MCGASLEGLWRHVTHRPFVRTVFESVNQQYVRTHYSCTTEAVSRHYNKQQSQIFAITLYFFVKPRVPTI